MPGGNDRIEAGPAPQIEHGPPRLQVAPFVRIPDASERRDGTSGCPVEPLGRIAEQLRRLTAMEEVEVAIPKPIKRGAHGALASSAASVG